MNFRTAAVLLFFSVALAACGGGGSAATGAPPASDTPVTPPEDPTGQVSLLIADNPLADFDRAIVVIDQILLLAEDQEEANAPALLDAAITVDLLDLQNISELIADGVSVPAGDYEKVRLEVSSLTLQKLDENGSVIQGESVDVALPAGKIDLVSRDDIVVANAGDLTLEIDIDLASSIKESVDGVLRFRPVVFVDKLDRDNRGRDTRLFGIVREIDGEAGTFTLCSARRLSDDDDQVDMTRCVDVSVGEDTEIVDSLDALLTIADLSTGELATVYGHFLDGVIDANVIELGERLDFFALDGEVVSPVDDLGRFTVLVERRELRRDGFELDDADSDDDAPDTQPGGDDDVPFDDGDDAERGRELVVQLGERSRILGEDNEELTAAAITVGAEVELRGLKAEAETGERFFKAFIVHVETDGRDDDDEGDDVELSGELIALDLASGSFFLLIDQQTEVCVRVDDDTDFFRIVATDDAVSSSEISVAELAAGIEIEVSGERDEDGCIEAEDIVLDGASDSDSADGGLA
ncbi:MAG: DUF4382 domain-containing protein [Pseudomonadota bacterium]